jgi:hypothetical protein
MAMELTKLAEAAVIAKGYWAKFENRFSNYGAFKAYLDNARALLPESDIERIKNQSNGRDIVVPTMTKATLSIITARACTITGTEPASVKPTLTRITRGFEIKIYPKVGENNYFSETAQFAQQLNNGLRSVLVNLDTYSAAQLEANKSTSLVAPGMAGVAVSGNAYQVSADERERLYFYLPTLLELNDMNSGMNNNIATTQSMELMLEYESKGANNEQNLAAVLRGDLPSASGFRHYRSNRISNGAGVSETHYLIPFGGIGVFTWNDSDALAKRKGPNKELYTMEDPIMGIRWDVMEEPICDDITATYGEGFERTMGMKYQFAADFGFLHAYSSDTSRANIKVEVLESA